MFLAGGADDAAANAMNMYNTGQIGSGANPIGTTSTIVEQESNPELQQARIDAMTEQQRLLMQQQAEVQQQNDRQVAEDEMINEQKLAEFNATQQAQQQQQSSIANTALKQGAKLYNPEAFAQNNLNTSNAYGQLGQDVMSGIKNMKPVTQYAQLPSTLSNTVTSSGLSTIPTAGATVNAGTMAGTGFKAGLSQVGAGLGNFAKSPTGIGTIASLAGEGIYRLADDKDETTLTFGEGSGKVLKGVGSGLATGAMIGSAVGGPLAPISGTLGAIIGGGVALGKGIVNRNKARKEEDRLESEAMSNRNVGINRFNEDLMSNYGSHLSSIRQGELDQKSISGQDLGYNLVAREGGVRYENGGFPPGLGAGMGGLGMNMMQRSRLAESGSRIGGGVLGNVANNFGQSVNPNAAPLYGPGFRHGGMKYGHGGLSEVQMPIDQQGMMQHQGMMPTQGMPQPQQPMYKRGGMRMGMPRYGYAV